MQEMLHEVERALRARGLSASRVSLRAVGSKELIHEMRRGRVPSVERFKALCEVLGLEFYVGPPRRPAPVDSAGLERALEAADHGLGLAARSMDSPGKARFVAAIYDLIGEDAANNAARMFELIETFSDHRRGDQIRVIWSSPLIPVPPVTMLRRLPHAMKADLVKLFLRLDENDMALAEAVEQGKTLGLRRVYHEDYEAIIEAKLWVRRQR